MQPRRIYNLNKKKKELTYEERLVQAKAIILEENSIIEDMGNGYCKITPIDPTKVVTEETFKTMKGGD